MYDFFLIQMHIILGIKLSTLISIIYHQKETFLYFSSFHNVLKSMAFMSGGVQKDLDSKHLLLHSASSSWSLPYLITSLSMQALAKSSSCTNRFYLEALERSHL